MVTDDSDHIRENYMDIKSDPQKNPKWIFHHCKRSYPSIGCASCVVAHCVFREFTQVDWRYPNGEGVVSPWTKSTITDVGM